MHLFFDTETTGLPRNWKAPVTDVNNWPRMIQIGCILSDKGNRIDTGSFIIKPENFMIPSEASRVHGITTKRAITEGVDLENVLGDIVLRMLAYHLRWIKLKSTWPVALMS
jgi:DNA polymerase III epsilon subunit-like protein